MATDELEYDNKRSIYVEWKKWSIDVRKSVQDYTIFKCMLRSLLDEHGLLTGQRVLGLACGQGYYTRRLKALNCAYILGVDTSSTMIDIASNIEEEFPKNIEYMVADAQQLPPPEQPFHLVTAVHLLNYARTRDELFQMVRTIYSQLGENKYFIGVTLNVVAGKDIFNTDIYRKYGFAFYTKTPLNDNSIPEGTELDFTLYNNREEVLTTFSIYYFSPATYEEVFQEAGFRKFEWVPLQCDPDLPNRVSYSDFVNCASSIGIIAVK